MPSANELRSSTETSSEKSSLISTITWFTADISHFILASNELFRERF